MSGTAGHIKHPYELYNYTTRDIIKLTDDLLININNYKYSEKVDGFNLFVSWKDKLILARNKTDLKSKDKDVEYYKQYYINKQLYNMCVTLDFACESLSYFITKNKLEYLFDNGDIWLNIEILSPFTNNIIEYNNNKIILHSIHKNDEIISIDLDFGGKYKYFTLSNHSDIYIDQENKSYKDMIIDNLLNDTVEFKNTLKSYNTLLEYYKVNAISIINKEYKLFYKKDIINGSLVNFISDRIIATMTSNNLPRISEYKKNNTYDNIDDSFVKYIDNNTYMYINKIRNYIELYYIKLGYHVLNYVENTINTEYTYFEETLTKIYKYETKNNQINKYFDKIFYNFASLNLKLKTEGIVIIYNNDTIKLTGIFGSLNQILFDYKNKRL
ncbi:MAG: hypothetical protein RSC92_04810 [Clostridia bacterium]